MKGEDWSPMRDSSGGGDGGDDGGDGGALQGQVGAQQTEARSSEHIRRARERWERWGMDCDFPSGQN